MYLNDPKIIIKHILLSLIISRKIIKIIGECQTWWKLSDPKYFISTNTSFIQDESNIIVNCLS